LRELAHERGHGQDLVVGRSARVLLQVHDFDLVPSRQVLPAGALQVLDRKDALGPAIDDVEGSPPVVISQSPRIPVEAFGNTGPAAAPAVPEHQVSYAMTGHHSPPKALLEHVVQATFGSGIQDWIGDPGLVVAATAFAFGHLTPDVGLFALIIGPPALRRVFGALQSLAFTLGSGALAFVRAFLSLVCQLFAVVCDSVPLVPHPLSLVREPLAPCELSLASRESLLALSKLSRQPIELRCPAIELTSLVGTVLRHAPRLR
jgi:hypothetical protein